MTDAILVLVIVGAPLLVIVVASLVAVVVGRRSSRAERKRGSS